MKGVLTSRALADAIMKPSSLSSTDRFDVEYPEDLPDRLAWLESRLQVPRSRIVRLMGLSETEAAALGQRSWEELAHAHEAGAERAEHFLTHYLSFFDYDAEKAGDFARELSKKMEEGTVRLSDHVPGLLSARTPGEQEAILLGSLQEDEGPNFLPALARILAGPAGER
jgi:hypothetical protein